MNSVRITVRKHECYTPLWRRIGWNECAHKKEADKRRF